MFMRYSFLPTSKSFLKLQCNNNLLLLLSFWNLSPLITIKFFVRSIKKNLEVFFEIHNGCETFKDENFKPNSAALTVPIKIH